MCDQDPKPGTLFYNRANLEAATKSYIGFLQVLLTENPTDDVSSETSEKTKDTDQSSQQRATKSGQQDASQCSPPRSGRSSRQVSPDSSQQLSPTEYPQPMPKPRSPYVKSSRQSGTPPTGGIERCPPPDYHSVVRPGEPQELPVYRPPDFQQFNVRPYVHTGHPYPGKDFGHGDRHFPPHETPVRQPIPGLQHFRPEPSWMPHHSSSDDHSYNPDNPGVPHNLNTPVMPHDPNTLNRFYHPRTVLPYNPKTHEMLFHPNVPRVSHNVPRGMSHNPYTQHPPNNPNPFPMFNPNTHGLPPIPNAPGLSHNPNAPGLSHIPNTPGLPHNINTPGLSHNPNAPGLSHNQNTPGLSHNPNAPGLPHNINTPGLSHNPNAPGLPPNPNAPDPFGNQTGILHQWLASSTKAVRPPEIYSHLYQPAENKTTPVTQPLPHKPTGTNQASFSVGVYNSDMSTPSQMNKQNLMHPAVQHRNKTQSSETETVAATTETPMLKSLPICTCPFCGKVKIMTEDIFYCDFCNVRFTSFYCQYCGNQNFKTNDELKFHLKTCKKNAEIANKQNKSVDKEVPVAKTKVVKVRSINKSENTVPTEHIVTKIVKEWFFPGINDASMSTGNMGKSDIEKYVHKIKKVKNKPCAINELARKNDTSGIPGKVTDTPSTDDSSTDNVQVDKPISSKHKEQRESDTDEADTDEYGNEDTNKRKKSKRGKWGKGKKRNTVQSDKKSKQKQQKPISPKTWWPPNEKKSMQNTENEGKPKASKSGMPPKDSNAVQNTENERKPSKASKRGKSPKESNAKKRGRSSKKNKSMKKTDDLENNRTENPSEKSEISTVPELLSKQTDSDDNLLLQSSKEQAQDDKKVPDDMFISYYLSVGCLGCSKYSRVTSYDFFCVHCLKPIQADVKIIQCTCGKESFLDLDDLKGHLKVCKNQRLFLQQKSDMNENVTQTVMGEDSVPILMDTSLNSETLKTCMSNLKNRVQHYFTPPKGKKSKTEVPNSAPPTVIPTTASGHVTDTNRVTPTDDVNEKVTWNEGLKENFTQNKDPEGKGTQNKGGEKAGDKIVTPSEVKQLLDSLGDKTTSGDSVATNDNRRKVNDETGIVTVVKDNENNEDKTIVNETISIVDDEVIEVGSSSESEIDGGSISDSESDVSTGSGYEEIDLDDFVEIKFDHSVDNDKDNSDTKDVEMFENSVKESKKSGDCIENSESLPSTAQNNKLTDVKMETSAAVDMNITSHEQSIIDKSEGTGNTEKRTRGCPPKDSVTKSGDNDTSKSEISDESIKKAKVKTVDSTSKSEIPNTSIKKSKVKTVDLRDNNKRTNYLRDILDRNKDLAKQKVEDLKKKNKLDVLSKKETMGRLRSSSIRSGNYESQLVEGGNRKSPRNSMKSVSEEKSSPEMVRKSGKKRKNMVFLIDVVTDSDTDTDCSKKTSIAKNKGKRQTRNDSDSGLNKSKDSSIRSESSCNEEDGDEDFDKTLQDVTFKQSKSKKNSGLYICQKCEMSFRNFYSLAKHMHSHSSGVDSTKKDSNDSSSITKSLRSNSSTVKSDPTKRTDTSSPVSHAFPPSSNEHSPEPVVESSSMDTFNEFICGVCNCGLDSQDELEEHMRMHLPQDVFECGVCTESFSSGDKLQAHMIELHRKPVYHHAVVEMEEFVCGVCETSFPTPEQLQYHMPIHIQNLPQATPDQIPEAQTSMMGKDSVLTSPKSISAIVSTTKSVDGVEKKEKSNSEVSAETVFKTKVSPKKNVNIVEKKRKSETEVSPKLVLEIKGSAKKTVEKKEKSDTEVSPKPVLETKVSPKKAFNSVEKKRKSDTEDSPKPVLETKVSSKKAINTIEKKRKSDTEVGNVNKRRKTEEKPKQSVKKPEKPVKKYKPYVEKTIKEENDKERKCKERKCKSDNKVTGANVRETEKVPADSCQEVKPESGDKGSKKGEPSGKPNMFKLLKYKPKFIE